jgi:Tol biopolymer transport system component
MEARISVPYAPASPPTSTSGIAATRLNIAFGIVDEVDSDAGVFYEGFYIGTMDPTGRNQRRIGARLGDDGLDAADPAFSPKGRFLALWSADSWGLMVTRPNGRPVRRLTRPKGRLVRPPTPLTYVKDSSPTWSPDGLWIAFDRQRCESEGDECTSLGVYTIERDGTGRRRITASGVEPSWSAQGEIAFVADSFPLAFRSGGGPIMVTNAGGTQIRDLGVEGNSPDWSPDGGRIVVAGYRSPYSALFVINADGTGLRMLYASKIHTLDSPVWSPDGRRIAFLRTRRWRTALTTISPLGRDIRRGPAIECRRCEGTLARTETLDWQALSRQTRR